MKGICHKWSRGRRFSSWRQVSESWLQNRSPSHNLREHRLVRRSGATSFSSFLCKKSVLGTLSCADANALEKTEKWQFSFHKIVINHKFCVFGALFVLLKLYSISQLAT